MYEGDFRPLVHQEVVLMNQLRHTLMILGCGLGRLWAGAGETPLRRHDAVFADRVKRSHLMQLRRYFFLNDLSQVLLLILEGRS